MSDRAPEMVRGDRHEVLKRALVEIKDLRARLEAFERSGAEPIAIVGMACRLPGDADSPDAFWRLLADGRDATCDVPADRWDSAAYFDPDPSVPGKMYTRRGGFLAAGGVDRFDPFFFDISMREAISLDPQQRLLLELTWEALESGDIPPSSLGGCRGGVFVGITTNDYGLLQSRAADPQRVDPYVVSGNALNFAAGRLAFSLGVHGPTMAIDTACSSSLVAVHLACASLRSGESDLAVVGGVNLILAPDNSVYLSRSRMLSADGRCKTFDAAADGYGRGEGGGVIVLKRSSDARANARIFGMIRGSAVNQDGPSSGLTVPNGIAQQALIREALSSAQVAPAHVGYVEAHGTGTSLGDPIELAALGAVYGRDRDPSRPLLVGSAKTNLGHLEAAAGIAGLIKAVLVLQHGQIPPHLHLRTPNPYVRWAEVPVQVPTELTDWPSEYGARLAAVSSFGVSGTNAHVILEAAAPPTLPAADDPAPVTGLELGPYLLTVSARTPTAVSERATQLDAYLAANPDVPPGAVCSSANVGRDHYAERVALVAETREGLVAGLRSVVAGESAPRVVRGRARTSARPVAFLFSGQGAQFAGMGLGLARSEPVVRAALEEAGEVLGPLLEVGLLDILGSGEDQRRTELAQPALVALEVALARLWLSRGIEPSVVVGHSVGELSAACVAEAVSLAEVLALAVERGRLMQGCVAGGMAAVRAETARVQTLLGGMDEAREVSVAADNAPDETVLSGASASLERVLERLTGMGVAHRRLAGGWAFHSPLVEGIGEALSEAAGRARWRAPRRLLVSSATGRVADEGWLGPRHWAEQARRRVQFRQAMGVVAELGCRRFVEVGPGTTLLGLARRCLGEVVDGVWAPTIRAGRDEASEALESLAALYVDGASVAWRGVSGQAAPPHVPLPHYPWQRERCWFPTAEANPAGGVQGGGPAPAVGAADVRHPLLGRRLSSPLAAAQFESDVTRSEPGLLAEHQVFGLMVAPGVLYLELALAAFDAAFPEQTPVLRQLALEHPLVLDPRQEQARVLQVILSTPQAPTAPSEPQSASVRIFSRAVASDSPWQQHVSGIFDLDPPDVTPPPDPVGLSAAREGCGDELSGDQFYSRVWSPDFTLGPGLRRIERVWRGHNQALGLVRAGSERGVWSSVRPGLLVLDACVQLLTAALPARLAPAESGIVYVGVGQETARVYALGLPPQVWCHAVLRNTHDLHESILGDLRVYGDDGTVLAEMTGVRLSRVTRAVLERVASARTSPSVAGRMRSTVLRAAPGERVELIRDYLMRELANVLQMPRDQLDPEQPVLGLVDSLMAVELKQQVESNLSTEVPIAMLLSGASIQELADVLERQLAPRATPETDLREADPSDLAELVASLESLPEEDALALLGTDSNGLSLGV